jgi:hypothetical protein
MKEIGVRRKMNEDKLKPCPFCGSKAEFLKYVGEENRKDIHKVSCMADNSDHHGEEGVSEDWCPMEAQTDWELTKEKAAEIWNTRHLETQLQKAKDLIHHAADENERLKEELESAILLLKKSTGFVWGSLLQKPIKDFIKKNTPLPEPKKEEVSNG